MFKDGFFPMWLSKTLKVFFYKVYAFKVNAPGENKYTVQSALKWVFAQRVNLYLHTRKWKNEKNKQMSIEIDYSY